MATQKQLDNCYMTVAKSHAELSKARRKKVGSCIVTTQGVILGGCNGFSPGGSNNLEYEDQDGNLVTRSHVIHSELNNILKAAKEGVSVVGGTLYTTLSCCLPCSEMIIAAGIKRVVYLEEYRDTSGLCNLQYRGVEVEKFKEN